MTPAEHIFLSAMEIGVRFHRKADRVGWSAPAHVLMNQKRIDKVMAHERELLALVDAFDFRGRVGADARVADPPPVWLCVAVFEAQEQGERAMGRYAA